jgi:hypothetical protein
MKPVLGFGGCGFACFVNVVMAGSRANFETRQDLSESRRKCLIVMGD